MEDFGHLSVTILRPSFEQDFFESFFNATKWKVELITAFLMSFRSVFVHCFEREA